MKTPNTDKISITFSTPYVSKFTRGDAFASAVYNLSEAMSAGVIWNQEFIYAKSNIADGCEHAQHIASDPARGKNADGSAKYYGTGDVRNDIGYAFGMNQAAKMARDLRKKLKGADFTKEIAAYCETLDQIVEWNVYLKAFKPLIKKGRRPVVKNEADLAAELFNTGDCAICANSQKLDDVTAMVMHGYKMSEYNHAGYRMGKCFGVGYKPYELSNEANVAFKPILASYKIAVTAELKTLKSGKIVSVQVTRDKWEGGRRTEVQVTFTKEANPREFNDEMENRISHVEFQIRQVNSDIKINDAKIANWTLQPLKYGSKAEAAKA